MQYRIHNMYSVAMVGNKRPYIEVGKSQHTLPNTDDPLKVFACMLKERYGGKDDTVEYNKTLLERLIQKNQIAKSSIVWHEDTIVKIYGFKVDEIGRIEYDISGSNSPDRRAKTYVSSAPNVDMFALRDAILRSKQTAV